LCGAGCGSAAADILRRSSIFKLITRRYPALHLYIYTALQKFLPGEISSSTQVRAGQYVFLGLYLITFLLVSIIYYLAGADHAPAPAEVTRSGSPPTSTKRSTPSPTSSNASTSTSSSPFPQILLIPLTLSKRLHSIYLLRLFNDPFAMVLLYAAVAVMMAGKRYALGWTVGCWLFS
jgi:alpha-1,3-mannosyltransferase